MKKLALPIALLLISGLAYAKGKPLADKQLDKISAGSAIADGESTATDSRSFSLDLDGSALMDASAVNIVNAVDSTVANATNIWSGDHATFVGSPVVQNNSVSQRGVPCDCGTPGEVEAVTETTMEAEEDLATANAIALDGSKADNKTDMTLELSGAAEQGAHAVNIVNSVGSLVANATNIASTIGATVVGSPLTQVNTITQQAH